MITDPDIQAALMPGGPGLHLLTSAEGLSPEQLAEQAKMAVGLSLSARAILGQLPEDAFVGALADDMPAPKRDALLAHVPDASRERIVPLSYGLGGAETAASGPTKTGETAVARNQRVLRGEFTPQEQSNISAILMAHRAGSMATAAA